MIFEYLLSLVITAHSNDRIQLQMLGQHEITHAMSPSDRKILTWLHTDADSER